MAEALKKLVVAGAATFKARGEAVEGYQVVECICRCQNKTLGDPFEGITEQMPSDDAYKQFKSKVVFQYAFSFNVLTNQ